MTREVENTNERFQRVIRLARRGLFIKSMVISCGFAAGGFLLTWSAGLLSLVTNSADLFIASALAGFAVAFITYRGSTDARAARSLDRALGMEAFSAAHACQTNFRGLAARSALEFVRGRSPVSLTSAGMFIAIAGPALGAGVFLLTPSGRVSVSNHKQSAAPAIHNILRSAAGMQRNANTQKDADAANEIISLAMRARDAEASAQDEAARALHDAIRELLQKSPDAQFLTQELQKNGGQREPLESAADAIQQFARVREHRGSRDAIQDRDGKSADESAQEASGARPDRPVSAGGPAAAATSSTPAKGDLSITERAWPAKYDGVVRRYFELDGVRSVPDGLQDSVSPDPAKVPQSKPAASKDQR
ncbi:MAG: hypothetical protein ACKVS6_10720 [Planctomycetota bacterium]